MDKNEKVEFRILEFDKLNRDGTVISKDACKDQDGKTVPLKWGSGQDAEIIGTVELEVCGDGLSIMMDEETYIKIMKIMKMTKEE